MKLTLADIVEPPRPSCQARLYRRSRRHHRWGRESPRRRLTFSPLAWLKLLCFLHAGEVEVGGFGISAEHDPLYVQDFVTVAQRVTAASVSFDDDAVADYFDRCVDQGIRPDRFARIWCHTHPGSSPQPSPTDEETFARVFGRCGWSVMFILGRTHRTYARLNLATGPGAQVPLEVAVDWVTWPSAVLDASQWPDKSGIFDSWIGECRRNIRPCPPDPRSSVDVDQWEQQAWGQTAALDLSPSGAGFAPATAPPVGTAVVSRGSSKCRQSSQAEAHAQGTVAAGRSPTATLPPAD